MGDQAGRIGWGSTCAAAQHALPVPDLNANGSRGAGDGKIDQAKEVVLSLWGDAGRVDMEAMAKARDASGNRAFVTCGDGKLTAADAAWGEFRVWQDADQDGVTVPTQRNPHGLSRQSGSLSGGVPVRRLMWAAVVGEADPITDGARRVPDAVGARAMDAPFRRRPDDTPDQAVLLRTAGCVDLLLQAMAADRRGAAAAGEDKAIASWE